MTLTINLQENETAVRAAEGARESLIRRECVRQVLNLAPEWLRKSWGTSKDAGLDQLSVKEIGADV